MSDNFPTPPAPAPTNKQVPKGPHATVRHGSVTVPIYAGTTGGKIRYAIAFHLDGRRHRRMFTDLDEAKREAKFAAEKIQRGLAANNDLSTRDREVFHAAKKLLQLLFQTAPTPSAIPSAPASISLTAASAPSPQSTPSELKEYS